MKYLQTFVMYVTFSITTTFGQQLSQYSMYMINPYLMNPAAAGTSDYYHINMGYRTQWGLINGPQTMFITGHGHLGKEHERLRGIHKNQNSWHHGMGFLVYRDAVGPFENYRVLATYAYDFTIFKNVRFSAGASLGMQNYRINSEHINLTKDIDPIKLSNNNKLLLDGNIGAWMYHKLWYVGASLDQIFMNNVNASPFPVPIGVNRLVQHYFITAGGAIEILRDPAIYLIPSIIIKANQYTSNPTFDINAKINFRELKWKDEHLLWAAVSYRNQDGLVFMFGAKFMSRFEFGYAYDLVLSELSARTSGTHELMLGLILIPRQRILSPSDFWR
ncbi:MAG: PorP/SprF family type IX secretion system membrane protein [Cytophagales bacterium]|nr:PorP/SprF family type IX secretion system membrane protein [Cytophagales bacterium]